MFPKLWGETSLQLENIRYNIRRRNIESYFLWIENSEDGKVENRPKLPAPLKEEKIEKGLMEEIGMRSVPNYNWNPLIMKPYPGTQSLNIKSLS